MIQGITSFPNKFFTGNGGSEYRNHDTSARSQTWNTGGDPQTQKWPANNYERPGKFVIILFSNQVESN